MSDLAGRLRTQALILHHEEDRTSLARSQLMNEAADEIDRQGAELDQLRAVVCGLRGHLRPRADRCEHDVEDGGWCPECNVAMKRARREAGMDEDPMDREVQDRWEC